MQFLLKCCSFTILCFFTLSSYAEVVPLKTFIQQMVEQHNFNQAALQQLFNQAKKRSSILKAIARPAGKVKPWYEYRDIFIQPTRIKAGVLFWRRYAKTLAKAEKQMGVPAEYVVAIIGAETNYGKFTGKNRVLDALYTLAFFYPRRADFFRQELEHFLLLTREEGFNPTQLKGSYTGAMGLGQFMPGSYRQYAIDFDGDGKRNIWTNEVDAIGSVANYFVQHGWQSGEPLLEATQVASPEAGKTLTELPFKPQYRLAELRLKGLQHHGQFATTRKSLVFDLEVSPGEIQYWLGFQNFYVITRYNRSTRYAMAVLQLAHSIKMAYSAP